MTLLSGKNLGYFFAYVSYVLSGLIIISPLHKTESLIISLLVSFLSSLVTFMFATKLSKKQSNIFSVKYISLPIAVTSCILSASASLMIITEIIKDIAYVANRGISLKYYILLSFAVLAVSFYLCFNTEKGIFRFSVLSFIPFLLLFIGVFFSFITTKSVVFDFSLPENSSYVQAIQQGISVGIFMTIDSTVFFYCFKSLFVQDKSFPKKIFIYGLIASFFIFAIYHIVTFVIFGSNLAQSLPDPDYALIKLIPGSDMTEGISALRIISFMIKSSVYIHSAAQSLNQIKNNNSKTLTLTISLIYLSIPLTVIILSVFNRNLDYGEFQHLIYPVIFLLSILIPISQKP